MQEDPVRYFQDLSENYRQMSDHELLELAATPADLTDVARQVLRDEIRRRRLDEQDSPRAGEIPGPVPRKNFDLIAGPLATPQVVSYESEAPGEEDEQPHDYTWKTLLCECNELVEARHLGEALKRAGIESWIEALSSYGVGMGGPRVMVAADQLEFARAIAARPIPPDILEESQIDVPEFAAPVCPECGAHDPVLESADPVNAWLCEACGAEWCDPEPKNDDDTDGEKSPVS
jgi:hypothetical protein